MQHSNQNTHSHWLKREFRDITDVLIYWDIPDCVMQYDKTLLMTQNNITLMVDIRRDSSLFLMYLIACSDASDHLKSS